MGLINNRYENAIDRQNDIDKKLVKINKSISDIKQMSTRESDCDTIPSDLSKLNEMPKSKLTQIIKHLKIPRKKLKKMNKEDLCRLLVKYSKKREQLIDLITKSIFACQYRIGYLLRGPNCEETPHALTASECLENQQVWNKNPYIPSPKSPFSDDWYELINSSQQEYLNVLSPVQDILTDLRNSDVTITIDQLKKLAKEMEHKLSSVQKLCKTVREKSFDLVDREKQMAKIAVLRSSNGLPFRV